MSYLYIILTLVIILLVILISIIYTLLSKFETLNEYKTDNIKSLGDFKYEVNNNMSDKLKNLELNVNSKISQSITEIITRITKIDEAQKNIDKLSVNILGLQSILNDKKVRGVFGEIQLNQVLYNIFGDKKLYYDLQYKMDNNRIVDAVVFAPEPLGLIPIDSKFPLENYNKIVETDGSDEQYKKRFASDVKKHISDISQKYIKEQLTNQAIIFIPAEAVFSYITVNCEDIVEYAYENKVWIASPMTLMAILTSIQMVIVNIQRNEFSLKLHEELQKLSNEFDRYQTRWDKVIKDFEKVSSDIKDISTTSQKITKKFIDIRNVKIE
ncbi:DNA recombination protein RmuC [Caviibacter abscessus]|uniref:DNA recombination protein RmuC n=1 Tax=Caviibacter abscessus TaxID=1766719 RepID=UPI000835F19E|nr:DNA recombination protein RmuC [Caviibacter abscessus]